MTSDFTLKTTSNFQDLLKPAPNDKTKTTHRISKKRSELKKNVGYCHWVFKVSEEGDKPCITGVEGQVEILQSMERLFFEIAVADNKGLLLFGIFAL